MKPRYDFVLWIEQNYPNLGPEIKYNAILEDTISIFKDDLNYKQDPRFIEILIKYVSFYALSYFLLIFFFYDFGLSSRSREC